ncbi:MAG: AsnC family transcriptional regulator [Sporomusaceae bacterium]|nr:AsnC family transcriptional regulator [Sporomusaceae bacterium]
MLNDFDKQLLNIIQSDIPLVSRPFAVLAERLGADEATVIERLRFLRENGFIRRIGPFFDSARLGYVSTLVALAVEPDDLPAVAAAVNAYPGVTHNYEREGAYNLWFALLSPNMAAQERVLAAVGGLPGIKRLLNLPATKKFKVNVRFTLE